jgi:hypothetical protein
MVRGDATNKIQDTKTTQLAAVTLARNTDENCAGKTEIYPNLAC